MSQSVSDPNGGLATDVLVPEPSADEGHLADLEFERITSSVQALPSEAVEAIPDAELAAALVPQFPGRPLPLPTPIPTLRRTTSGRYRGGNAGFQMELRVDVDGSRPLHKVSGDYFTVSGATTTFFGSWIIESPSVRITTANVVVEGIATCTWNTSYTKARVTIPRTLVLQPAGPATITWFNAAGTAGATYICPWESRFFRTVLWEQDSVAGTVPFVSYHTGALPQPPGSAARTLTVPAAFAEAGVELLTAGTPNIVPVSTAGTDSRWSDAELHAAMVANFSLWADRPQWRVHTLVATRYVSDGVRGIMYDASGSFQRQGMAVFHDAIGGTDAATQRAQLRTYVHELGHCFNLLHSWQKNLADPPQPLGSNGGLGDLSWMNYAWKFQPPPPAPGGETAYWAAFPFRFTPAELTHLRHGLRNNVIMGGNAFATGAAEIDPTVFAERESDRSGLELRLRARPGYALGEPVVVEIRLAATDRGGALAQPNLHPRDGLVQIVVQEPSGRVLLHRPIMPRCVDDTDTILLDEHRPAIYESAYLGYGRDGFTFAQPGTYRLRASYVAMDGSHIVSPVTTIRIRSPHNGMDDEVADLMMTDGQGELLCVLGTDAPSLAGANTAMDAILDRYPDHPLAVYARMVKGVNAGRAFKHLDARRSLQVRPADTDTAVRQLDAVIGASAGDRGIDNITLNMVIRTAAEAEFRSGDIQRATGRLDGMVDVFRAKGLADPVLGVIAGEAQRAKTRLMTELG
jgi:hypothetical protein